MYPSILHQGQVDLLFEASHTNIGFLNAALFRQGSLEGIFRLGREVAEGNTLT